MTRLKVVLATYNPGPEFEEQISSILNQEGISVTIDVFDDGSTQCDYLNKFCLQQDERIVLHKLSASKAAGRNFLRALAMVDTSKCDYVALSDQDDIWLPKKIQSAVEFMNENQADGYSSNLSLYDGKEVFGELKKCGQQTEFDHFFQGASAGCTYVISAALFDSLQKVVQKIDIQKLPDLMSHDWFIYFQARAAGFKWYHDERSFIWYRQHDENVYGAKIGIQGFFSRAALITDGLLKANTQVLRNVAIQEGYNGLVFEKTSVFSRLMLLTHFRKFRRERSLSFPAYVLWVLGKYYPYHYDR